MGLLPSHFQKFSMTTDLQDRDAGTLGREEIRGNLLRWIERLERNDLAQGSTRLRAGDNYCCLGVACEVMGWPWNRYGAEAFEARMPGTATRYSADDDDEYEIEVDDYAEGAELTAQAAARLGLTKREHDRCIALNDDEGRTFPEIAAWLRENVLPRFADPETAPTRAAQ